MATVSLCMIVKNEERLLARCLDSVADLMDEIIVVDTGSTDATKEIAARYTDKIYDFKWTDDFSAARNFSFSKATMDYIYVPDADEVLDEENRRAFAQLKQALLPEIEIVQMKYETVTEFDTVLNAKTEYRPKLFKRLREFSWIDPVHETVRLQPVVYDSEITITHMPENLHSKRDFSIFEKTIKRDGMLSEKLLKMYATELMKTGDTSDLKKAADYFTTLYDTAEEAMQRTYASCILAKYYCLINDDYHFNRLVIKEMTMKPCAEICYQLGVYYKNAGDYREASLWFLNAASETEAVLDIHCGGDEAWKGLMLCCERLLAQDISEQEREYFTSRLEQAKEEAERWRLPEE